MTHTVTQIVTETKIVSQLSFHSSCVRSKECNIANKTICLTAMLYVVRVVVGGWKGLVLTSQI